MSPRPYLRLCFVVACLGLTLFITSGAARSNETAAAASPMCDPNWQIVPAPSVYSPRLYAIDGPSSSDLWAVGSFADSSILRPLAMHWNGTGWAQATAPYVNLRSELEDVAAITANDAWAVGYSTCLDGCAESPLVEHWDGSGWSVVSVSGVLTDGILYGVDGVSSNDVWAVGMGGVIHWDGSQWSRISDPSLPSYGRLRAVDAVTANDVWVAGGSPSAVVHWNGSAWESVTVPDVGPLLSIKVISPNDIWAMEESTTLHWNGTVWSEFDFASTGIHHALDGTSANDVWAVGSAGPGPIGHTLVEHWNGSEWTIEPSPSFTETATSILYGVRAFSGTDVWAVGHGIGEDGAQRMLVERDNRVGCPRCPGERFTDVCPTDYFYEHVLTLNDLGVIAGYNTAPPCDGPEHVPCFKPYNWTTRGQLAKIVSLAAGFNEPAGAQLFEDVPQGHTFYDYIWRLANRGIVGGYPCGGPGEPCGAGSLPYYRPGNTITRGQMTKIADLTFGFNEPVSTRTFEDVPPGHTFYTDTERLAVRGIVGGYDCGNPEPCVPPGNRPYFRPGNTISRGQIAKIVNLARTQSQGTPSPTPAIIPTSTTTPTPAATGTSTYLPRK